MPNPIDYLQPTDYSGFERLGRSLSELGDLRRAAEAQRLKQAQLEQYRAKFSAAMQDGSPEAMLQLTQEYPEQAQVIGGAFQALKDADKEQVYNDYFKVYAALENNSNDLVKTAIDDKVAAAQNANKDPGFWDDLQNIYSKDPEQAKKYMRYMMVNTDPERFKTLNEALKNRVELQKTEAETGKLSAEELKIKAETDKLNQELQALAGNKSILPPEKRIEKEMQLQNAYVKRADDLTSAQRNYEIMRVSAQQRKGQGDYALITSFMKMLDPGSTVRETEFASARDTGGLWTSLKAMVEGWKSGDILDDTQRQEFLDLSKQYLDAAIERDKSVKKGLMPIINNYGLNPENIFVNVHESSTGPLYNEAQKAALKRTYGLNDQDISALEKNGDINKFPLPNTTTDSSNSNRRR